MSYTKKEFKEVLDEYKRMEKDNEEFNSYDYGYYRAMIDYENLILCGVGISFR